MEILKHNMIAAAAKIVKEGGVFVYPSDTVWGLGCSALDKTACARLNELKKRPTDTPLIWLFPSVKAVKIQFPQITRDEEKLLNIKHTSVVLKSSAQAVRVIKNGWLNKLLSKCGVPLVSTSANLHGQHTAASWRQAAETFVNADAVIKGRKIYNAQPSTVIRTENGQITILRAGGGICIK